MVGSHTRSGSGVEQILRAVRKSLRPFRAHRHDQPLEPTQAHAEIHVLHQPLLLTTGQTLDLRVRLLNQSALPFSPQGTHPTRITHRWLTWDGHPHNHPVHHDLVSILYPGEPSEQSIRVQAPDEVGDFILDVDLTQPGLGSFTDETTGSLIGRRFPLQVTLPRDRDIDYHDVFRTADLSQNHWWVVGDFKSREHYERSTAERIDMLVREFGLTPDSRVLDIGCGTGQIASGLSEYLSDRGAYYGTDLAHEAIEFCKRTYTRANFVFRVNPMTSVPITDHEGPFDLAMFFSVFTHTHVDESVLLLGEAKRLLAPNGRIIADFFVSPFVERGLGNRGAMDLNEAHFLRLTDLLGLKAEIFARLPWCGKVERLMVCFRRM